MADVEADVDISVEGSAELQAAAEAASRLADEIAKAEAAAQELSAGAGDIGDLDAALGSAADAAEAFSRAADSARDSLAEVGLAGEGTDAVAASLSAAADMAEGLAEGARQARDDLGEIVAGSGGLEAVAAGLSQDAASARELSAALGSARDKMAELAGEGGIVQLTSELHNAGAGMYDFETGASDAALAAQALGLGAVDAEQGLEDVEGAAGDAESALGGGGGLSAALGAVTDGFSELGGVVSDLPDVPDWLKTGALWTGIATLVAGAASVLTPLAAGMAGFGALAVPALYKVYEGWQNVSTAQQAYQQAVATEKGDPTAANLKAEKQALDALHGAWKTMPAGIEPTISAVKRLWAELQKASKTSGIQKDLFGDLPKAVKDVQGLIPAFSQLGKAFSPEIGKALRDFQHFEVSPGFKTFITDLDKDMPSAGHAVREVAGALGSIMTSLVKPGNEKDFAGMFTGLASGLKAVTPGAVHELGQVAVEIGKIGAAIKKVQGGSLGHTIGRVFDDLMDVPSAEFRGLRKSQTALTGFTEYMAESAGKTPVQDQQIWNKIFGGSSAAATKAGNQAGKNYTAALSEAMAVKARGHQEEMPGAKEAAAKQGKDIANATAQAVRQSPALKTATQDALSKSAKNIKIHGATVDLSNAKLSGLTQLDSVLQKAAETAGQDYDKALGQAINSSADVDTAAAKKLATDIVQAMSDLKSQMETIGDQAAEGLAAGIKDGTPAAVAAASSMANQVTAAAQTALQSHSPSLVFRQIGDEGIDGGLAEGITAGASGPVSSVNALMAQLVAAAKKGGESLQSEIKSQIAKAQAVAKATKSAAASYASLSSIEGQGVGKGKNDQYPTLQVGMQVKLANIQHFYEQLKKLKKEGLSESLIKQIAEAGPQAGEQMAKQLLETGKGGIHHADKIEKAIEKWTGYLGRLAGNASTEPYKDIGKPIASALKGALHDVKLDGHIDNHISLEVKVLLDGKEVSRKVQTATLQRANRNTSSGLKLKTRGA